MIGEERRPRVVGVAPVASILVRPSDPAHHLLPKDEHERERHNQKRIPDRDEDDGDGVHPVCPDDVPCGVTTTSPIVAGSCSGLPLSVALRFQGAPTRIQSRPTVKRTVCPWATVDSKTSGPLAEPRRTMSQQRPRAAVRTSLAVVGAERAARLIVAVACRVVRTCVAGGASLAWWPLPRPSCQPISATIAARASTSSRASRSRPRRWIRTGGGAASSSSGAKRLLYSSTNCCASSPR